MLRERGSLAAQPLLPSLKYLCTEDILIRSCVSMKTANSQHVLKQQLTPSKPVVSDFYSHGQLLSLVLRKNIGFYVLKHQIELKTEITWNDEYKEFAV